MKRVDWLLDQDVIFSVMHDEKYLARKKEKKNYCDSLKIVISNTKFTKLFT